MRKILPQLEPVFEAMGQGIIRYPTRVIWITLLMSGIMIGGVFRLYMDVSNESFFKKNDPALLHYQSFLKQFGRDEAVIAAISAPDVLAPAFLSKLEAYHKDLEASVPYLDLLTSLVNVTSISDREGELLIDDLRNVWPSRYEDARPFRQAVLENPLYRNLVVTEDGKMTVVIIRSSAFAVEQEAKTQTSLRERIANWHDRLFANMEKNESSEDSQQPNSPSRSTSKNELDTSFLPENVAASVSDTSIQKVPPKHLSTQQLNQFMQAIREVSARHQETDFPIRLAGGPVIDAEHNHTIHQDFGTLLPLTAVMVFLILLLLLRRVSAAIIAMLPVFLCLFVTIGVMGWLGFPVNQVSVAMPPLILTVCIGDSVHILSLFYSRLQSDGDRDRAIVYALKRSGVAILFTSLTTAAGFLAFTMSDIKPIAEFGVMIAFAAMAAFIYSVVLVPAVLSCTGASIQEVKRAPRSQWVVKVLSKITEFSMVHFKEVLLTTFALIVIAAPSLWQLRFSQNVLEWFPEHQPARVNTLAIDAALKGSIPLEVVIDTGKPHGIYSPQLMRKLEAFERFSESLQLPGIQMGRATSIVDTLKRIHSVLYQDQPQNSVPDDPDLIAQELLLFESSGADDVEKLIDSNFSMARITVRMSWADAVDYIPLRDELEKKAQQIFAGIAEVNVTGSIDLMSASMLSLLQSMSSSYLFAGIVIALMLIFLLRSFTLGLVAMIPNFLPIFISLSIMGYFDIPLNLFTVLLGGIALGLAVDDTIHFMHGFRYNRQKLQLPLEDSVKNTITTIGPAMLFTTIAMTGGFFIFIFSSMDVLVQFGLLMGLTIVNAMLADVLIGPALVKFLERLGWRMSGIKPNMVEV